MAAKTVCRACGGTIVITADGATTDVLAIGDQFFHSGCIEAPPPDDAPEGPAYFIPRDW